METYRTWVRLFELQRYYSWTVDRFHISTRAYQLKTYGKDYDFTWLEQRLNALGFHLVFCTRRPESFAAARAERLKVSGKPFLLRDDPPFGGCRPGDAISRGVNSVVLHYEKMSTVFLKKMKENNL